MELPEKDCRMAQTQTKTSCIKVRDFDDILEKVGSYGRYQKLRVAFLFVPLSFYFGLASMSVFFEMVIPPHWCHVPGRENTTLSQQQWNTLTIPQLSQEPGKLSSCLMYDGFWETHNGTTTYTITNQTKECSHGWDFDQSDFTETDPSYHGWVCDKEPLAHSAISINLAGRAIGTLILPIIADNFVGRRLMFYVAVGTYVVFTLPLLWVSSVPGRFIFRFLQALGFETNYVMPYVILLEIIPPARRAFTIMLTFVSWTLGMCFMSLVAWLAGDWKLISIVSILPLLTVVVYWKILPESPRFLLSKGRLRECADILLKIGKTNGKLTLSREKVEEELAVLSLRMPPKEPLTKVFIYPKLRLRACMLFLFSFTIYFMYGVVLLSMTVMPGNYFMSHFVLTIFEVPSVFVGLIVTNYFGRRFLGYIFLLLAAVCCTAAPFCINHQWTLIGVLALSKLSITCNIYLVFMLPSEILPTPVRSSGAGMVVVTGMVAMAISPYLLHFGLSTGYHYWILLGMTFVGAVCLAPIPETLGLPMPQTFLDAEELGRGRPLTAWIHHWNLHKYPAAPSHDQEEAQDLMNEKGQEQGLQGREEKLGCEMEL